LPWNLCVTENSQDNKDTATHNSRSTKTAR